MRSSSVISNEKMVQKDNERTKGDGVWDNVIPATQRADGSWRKERVVRAGYTPKEEIKKYDARAARENRLRHLQTSISASPPLPSAAIVTPIKPEGTAGSLPVPPSIRSIVTPSKDGLDVQITNKDDNTKYDRTIQSSSSAAANNNGSKNNKSITPPSTAAVCNESVNEDTIDKDGSPSPTGQQLETTTAIGHCLPIHPQDNNHVVSFEKAVKTCDRDEDDASIALSMKSLSIAASTVLLPQK